MMAPNSEPHAVSDIVAGLLAGALLRQVVVTIPFMNGVFGSVVNGASLWFLSRGYGGGVHEGMRIASLGSAAIGVGQVLEKTAGDNYIAGRAASAWYSPLSGYAMVHARRGEL